MQKCYPELGQAGVAPSLRSQRLARASRRWDQWVRLLNMNMDTCLPQQTANIQKLRRSILELLLSDGTEQPKLNWYGAMLESNFIIIKQT